MKLITTLFVAVGVMFTSSCGFLHDDRPDTESEATMQPTSLTVTEAARVVAGYVSMIVDKPIDPNPDLAALHGCRTNDAMMPAGPPWKVYRNASIVDPAPELVEGALTRIDTLADQGFERVAWSRPDPEPPNYKRYRDSRGYFVLVRAEVNPGGVYALEVSATSPCANED
ncbi:hypothetical protein [Mycolicibacterium sp. HK-90]|uniref:hypothetical protein n=1 Tax=Mycolicibacterium sp. HK-90 TaxID=3056937 RepID=UPI002658A1AF|nr:hypothetical protein [Mycolicibacterium sp. HK-90]WKG03856.1 hypothetical protein QU592_01550 [Mycolicibacterium sp. HK-90]